MGRKRISIGFTLDIRTLEELGKLAATECCSVSRAVDKVVREWAYYRYSVSTRSEKDLSFSTSQRQAAEEAGNAMLTESQRFYKEGS